MVFRRGGSLLPLTSVFASFIGAALVAGEGFVINGSSHLQGFLTGSFHLSFLAPEFFGVFFLYAGGAKKSRFGAFSRSPSLFSFSASRMAPETGLAAIFKKSDAGSFPDLEAVRL